MSTKHETATRTDQQLQPETSGDVIGYDFFVKNKLSLVYIDTNKWQASTVRDGFFVSRTSTTPNGAIDALWPGG